MSYEDIVEARSKRDKKRVDKAREGVPKLRPKQAAAKISKPSRSRELKLRSLR